MRVKTASEAQGYVPRARTRHGPISFIDRRIAASANSAAAVGTAAICEVSAAPTAAP